MLKLFLANLKMMVRDKQALFWSFAFPLMFTVIFGFFFGRGSVSAGTVALVQKSNTELAQNLEKTMDESDLFKIQKVGSIDEGKDLLKKNKITAIIEIPENFGSLDPSSPKEIKVIYDPGNQQSNAIIMEFLNAFFNKINFQIANTQPTFSIITEKTSDRTLNYFDFVLIGLIGLALMNSSIQGISIRMAKYREDKILKRITTTPLASWKFIFAEVLSRLILNVVQISVILLVGVYLFDANIYGNLFLIFIFGLIGAILFQSIGFVVAAVSKTTAAAEGMSTAIAIPMMFLAGVFFPIDQLPKWLFFFVQYLPLAPLLRMIRTIGLEASNPFQNPINIIIVMAWIVVMLVVASLRFRLSEE